RRARRRRAWPRHRARGEAAGGSGRVSTPRVRRGEGREAPVAVQPIGSQDGQVTTEERPLCLGAVGIRRPGDLADGQATLGGSWGEGVAAVDELRHLVLQEGAERTTEGLALLREGPDRSPGGDQRGVTSHRALL